jgi:hypothetical protein
MHLRLFAKVALAVSLAAALPTACSKTGVDGANEVAPATPAVPPGWKVQTDSSPKHNEREFLEIEGRLQGRVKAMRIATFDVEGKRVQLITIVPLSAAEGDKIYRILANTKQPWSYVRRGDLLYELVGPAEAEKEITSAHDMLAK